MPATTAVLAANLSPPASYDSAILVYGLFGIISLYNSAWQRQRGAGCSVRPARLTFRTRCPLAADYLIFITSRKRVSRVLQSDIYLARDFKVFPIDPSTSADAVNRGAGLHQPNETYLLSLIKGHLYSGPFYYTYGGYDVTSRMQAQDTVNDTRPLFERVGRARPSWTARRLNTLTLSSPTSRSGRRPLLLE